LSGAFGGVGSYSPFGTKTGDALTWATVILTGMFLLIAVLANYVYKPQKLGLGGSRATTTQTLPIDAGEGNVPALPAGAAAKTPAAPASQP
jgi:preprotein translocase subunit SecG